jgi:DNA-binding MarR family transcriptional regulator
MPLSPRNDLEVLDRALLRLRRFFAAPQVVDDQGRPVELSTMLVLSAVAGEGATVREIATRLDVAHSTASRFVTRAEQAGVVARQASTTDARATTVVITEDGRALDRRATTYRLQRLARLTQDWSVDELSDFAAATERFALRAVAD